MNPNPLLYRILLLLLALRSTSAWIQNWSALTRITGPSLRMSFKHTSADSDYQVTEARFSRSTNIGLLESPRNSAKKSIAGIDRRFGGDKLRGVIAVLSMCALINVGMDGLFSGSSSERVRGNMHLNKHIRVEARPAQVKQFQRPGGPLWWDGRAYQHENNEGKGEAVTRLRVGLGVHDHQPARQSVAVKASKNTFPMPQAEMIAGALVLLSLSGRFFPAVSNQLDDDSAVLTELQLTYQLNERDRKLFLSSLNKLAKESAGRKETPEVLVEDLYAHLLRWSVIDHASASQSNYGNNKRAMSKAVDALIFKSQEERQKSYYVPATDIRDDSIRVMSY